MVFARPVSIVLPCRDADHPVKGDFHGQPLPSRYAPAPGVKLSEMLGATPITLVKLRQEIFALGGRHLGDPLAGAKLELEDPALTPERRRLLSAVVRHLGSGKSGWTGAKTSPALSGPANLADAAYVGLIIAAGVWVTMIVRSMIA
jgi:hypothetical protein